MTQPVFMPIKEAAAVSGISERQLRSWVADKMYPLPHLLAGEKQNKCLVRLYDIERYAERMFIGEVKENREIRIASYVMNEYPKIYIEALNAVE